MQAGRLRALARQGRWAVAVLAAAAPLPLLVDSAGATLARVGPVDAATGFPTHFDDANGLRLGLCVGGPYCLAQSLEPVEPNDEAFWFQSEAALAFPGGDALLVLATEAAYAAPEAGMENAFNRVRIRANLPTPGTYTVTQPYGTHTFSVTSVTADREINFTDDRGCFATPGDTCNDGAGREFNPHSLEGAIGPFLTWDSSPPAPPAGHIGDAVTPHKVAGSPTGNNIFRITGPNGFVAQTDLFTVQGKIVGDPPPPAPAINFSPASLTFGVQKVGTTSAAQSVTVKNVGTAPLTVSSVSVAGTHPGDFTHTGNCVTTLAPGASCSQSVRFKPGAAGDRSAQLRFTDNAAGSPHAVALSGTGASPTASVSPTSLAFGNQGILAGRSAAKTATFTNTGQVPVTMKAVALTGANPNQFVITSNSCPAPGANLAVGASCRVAVAFDPSTIGSKSATLSIGSDAVAAPHLVTLTGNGTLI